MDGVGIPSQAVPISIIFHIKMSASATSELLTNSTHSYGTITINSTSLFLLFPPCMFVFHQISKINHFTFNLQTFKIHTNHTDRTERCVELLYFRICKRK